MPFTIRSNDPLTFALDRQGGALMTVRIAVFSNVGTPQQQRVRLLFMGGAQQQVETKELEALPAGEYQVVATSVIEEAVSGAYEYDVRLNGNVIGRRKGDVNESTGLDVDTFVHRKNMTVEVA